MARMRSAKKRLRELLAEPDWKASLEEIVSGGSENVAALFSFLLLAPEKMHRAACALGLLVAKLAKEDPDYAKNIVRRFMWHMNEESGNIGWGIPDAFAETLANSEYLAKTYSSILISYIMDLGYDDNYCDHDILRRECYWAVGRLAQKFPQLAEKARPWLLKGLTDKDDICRGMAAWALAQLAPCLNDVPALRKLAESDNQEKCEIFDGDKMCLNIIKELAKAAMQRDLQN